MSEIATVDGSPVWNQRLPDGGPRYAETPLMAPATPWGVAEPYNAATAALFIVLVGIWAWRLRGRYRQYPFLTACMPILLAGGVGGTLYHATRASRLFFLMDVIPISVLALAGAGYLAVRLTGRQAWRWIFLAVAGYLMCNMLLFQMLRTSNLQWRVNMSYALLAGLLLLPIGVALWRTRLRHAGWVAAGAISFVIAWFFRLVDQQIGLYLPMGSHWLWHIFGAVATHCVVEYFYRLEDVESLREGAGNRVSPPLTPWADAS